MAKEKRKNTAVPIGKLVKEISENMTVIVPDPPTIWQDNVVNDPYSRYRMQGYNSIAMNNCLHIKPITFRETKTKSGIIIPDSVAGNNKNYAPIGRVMSISPNLLSDHDNTYPDFRALNIKPGDLVYFNHLSGEGIRLHYKGKQTEIYSIFAINVFGVFEGNINEDEDDIDTSKNVFEE